MIKINTVEKAQDLYELAQEAPYPMAKRALDALKNGNYEEAGQILEELLQHLGKKNTYRLWDYLQELIFRVILWKQLPENEKEGLWLNEINKYREQIALLLYKQPELETIFEERLDKAISTAKELAETYLENQFIVTPSWEDIFETEHHWEIFNPQKA